VIPTLIFIEKSNLLATLPKSLFDSTSPFVECVKIIDTIKNDDERLEKAIKTTVKEHELFYSTLQEEQVDNYQNGFKNGLLDTICKVMIKEAGYEN
jgi:hypothetical protein